MKKTPLIVGFSVLLLLTGILLISGYLNQERKLDNEIIEVNASTERAVKITEENTELPVSLPSDIPFEVEDEYASVNIYNFDGDEEYHEATFNYENDTQLLKVIVSNVEVEREEGRIIQFENDKKYHYVEENNSQQIWWNYKEGIYYSLVYSSQNQTLLTEDEIFSLINQIN